MHTSQDILFPKSLSSNVCKELKEGVVSHLKVTKIPDRHLNGSGIHTIEKGKQEKSQTRAFCWFYLMSVTPHMLNHLQHNLHYNIHNTT